jgi:hypothetical protein
VLVCKPGSAPLRAFDAPLVRHKRARLLMRAFADLARSRQAYVRGERFNQPIFGCNNLSGSVFHVGEEGGPAGSLPPHAFTICFREARTTWRKRRLPS